MRLRNQTKKQKNKSHFKRNSGKEPWKQKSHSCPFFQGQAKEQLSQSSSQSYDQCFWCGRNHDHSTCPAKHWECFECDTKERKFYSNICKDKSYKKCIRCIDSIVNINNVNLISSNYELLLISLKINEVPINFKIDS